MSNLIKSQYINYGEEKKVIGWGQGFMSLSSSAQNVSVEEDINTSFSQEEFVDGIAIANMQRLVEEEEELLSQKADRLLLEANEAAEKVIEDAKIEAEQIRMAAMEEGKKAGYIEGFEQGQEELKNLEQQLEQQKQELKDDYCRMAAELEPKFATVVVRLLEKLTGVVAEDHKAVIMHLIGQGISEAEKSKSFLIKVSSEDYHMVAANKEKILRELPDDADLHILEVEEFAKNQCFIEADGRVMDCSLDVQMKSLIADLKMLACI